MSKVNFKGTPVALKGSEVLVGAKAPEVTLVGQDLSEFKVGGNNAKIEILVTIPSIDTGVCATETRKFNEKMAGKDGVKLSVISIDLPFAMGRFCGAEGIANVRVGSDFRAKEFGEKYGVLIDEGVLKGLLARAIFVIKDGVIVHKQIVPEITEEPNYEAVFEAVKSSGGCGCGCSH